jgi:hypothetical protein
LTGNILGSPWVVSLPPQEQQALDRIEGDLRGSAPRLFSMFLIFTRLTNGDGIPRTESIPPQRHPRISRLAFEVWLTIPVALGVVAFVVFLAVSSSSVQGCRPLGGAAYEVAANPVLSCQAAQKP